MFVGAAVWNMAGAAILFALTPQIFRWDGLALPKPATYYDTWLALCVVFGWGYFLVSCDLAANSAVVHMGIAGKLAFMAVFIAFLVRSPAQIPRAFWVPVAGDGWFALRFAMFLRWRRRRV